MSFVLKCLLSYCSRSHAKQGYIIVVVFTDAAVVMLTNIRTVQSSYQLWKTAAKFLTLNCQNRSNALEVWECLCSRLWYGIYINCPV
jgi:hypothetical protein